MKNRKKEERKFLKISKGNFFTLCGIIRETDNKGVFKTADVDLISALEKHPDFKELKGKADGDLKEKQ